MNVCAREGCENIVTPPAKRGFPKRFCSANCRKRDGEERARGRCACGKLMGKGTAYPSNRTAHCADCERKALRAAFIARMEPIAERWREGATFPELQREFNMSRGLLAVQMFRAREVGMDFPYRYRTCAGKRVA